MKPYIIGSLVYLVVIITILFAPVPFDNCGQDYTVYHCFPCTCGCDDTIEVGVVKAQDELKAFWKAEKRWPAKGGRHIRVKLKGSE